MWNWSSSRRSAELEPAYKYSIWKVLNVKLTVVNFRCKLTQEKHILRNCYNEILKYSRASLPIQTGENDELEI